MLKSYNPSNQFNHIISYFLFNSYSSSKNKNECFRKKIYNLTLKGFLINIYFLKIKNNIPSNIMFLII